MEKELSRREKREFFKEKTNKDKLYDLSSLMTIGCFLILLVNWIFYMIKEKIVGLSIGQISEIYSKGNKLQIFIVQNISTISSVIYYTLLTLVCLMYFVFMVLILTKYRKDILMKRNLSTKILFVINLLIVPITIFMLYVLKIN